MAFKKCALEYSSKSPFDMQDEGIGPWNVTSSAYLPYASSSAVMSL